jgi:hypothetical protein
VPAQGGSVSFLIEIEAENANGSTGYTVKIEDATTSEVAHTFTVPASTTNRKLPTETFVPLSGEHVYRMRLAQTANANELKVFNLQIRVRCVLCTSVVFMRPFMHTNLPINQNDLVSGDSRFTIGGDTGYLEETNSGLFLKGAGDYATIDHWSLESVAGNTGTGVVHCYVALFNRDTGQKVVENDHTAQGSTTEFKTTDFLDSAANFADDSEFVIYSREQQISGFGTNSLILRAAIYVFVTEFSHARVYVPVDDSRIPLGPAELPALEQAVFEVTMRETSAGTLGWKMVTSSSPQQNVGESDVAGSPLDPSGSVKTLYRSGALTLVTGDSNYYDSAVKTGSGSIAEAGRFAVLDMAADIVTIALTADFFLPHRIGATVRPDEGTSSIAGVTCSMLDHKQRFTRLMADDRVLKNKTARLKGGFRNIDEADFVTFFTGKVEDIRLPGNEIPYLLLLHDPGALANRKLWIAASQANPVTVGPAHPMDIAVTALTDPDPTGVGIDEANVDIAAFEAIRDATPGVTMTFTITEPLDVKAFLEREIYRPMSAYPFTRGDGKLSIRRFDASHLSAVAGDLDKTNIIGTPKLDKNFGTLRNAVSYRIDWNADTADFETTLGPYTDQDSIDKYGEKPEVIESKGFRSGAATTAFIETSAAARLQRYKDGAELITCKAFLQKNLFEVGDIVRFSSDQIPNYRTHVRGVKNRLMEIVNREVLTRAAGRKDVEVHGYDNETYNPGSLVWAREAFLKAKIPYNLAHMDSQEVDAFPFYDVGLYHIDGDHTYEAARHDIRCAWQGLGAKGVMIVDDVGWHPGIRQAVEEFAASHPVRLMLLPTLKGMAILEK